MSYHHLTIEERACLYRYYKDGVKQAKIANLLNRSKSCISRELRRNASREEGYNPVGAQRKYNKRRRESVRKGVLETDEKLMEKVKEGLGNYWSPEQIVNTLPEGYHVGISTIYRAVKAKLIPIEYAKKLRRYGKHRTKKKSENMGTYKEVRTYAQRPAHIMDRKQIGHWEMDTIVLRDECGCHLATMVERKQKLLLLRKIADKRAETMADVIIDTMKDLPRRAKKTLTVDRGAEFADWKRVEEQLGVKVYFADPGKPYQRATNENTNGLIRQFFPRRKILPAITDDYVAEVQFLINNRPRKILHWLSPAHLLHFT
jgi:Transposase and inactivated derivatives, IS30 family